MLKKYKSTKSFSKQILAQIKAITGSMVIFPLVFVLNIIQILLFVTVAPVSPRSFRAVNRFIANTYWFLLVYWMEGVNGQRLTFTGDLLPQRENALVIANHQNITDIIVILALAWRKERLGDLKWFVKNIVKYLPGPGWGMHFLGCLFVKRNWLKDENNITNIFAKIKQNQIPFWIISFLEGTRITQAKLKKSQKFAEKMGLKITKHVMVPRTRGFHAALSRLGDNIDAVYDITIVYPEGIPSLWQLMAGLDAETLVHIKRYTIADLPQQEAAIDHWVKERFYEKDDLLEKFYSEGLRPEPIISEPLVIHPRLFI